MNLDLMVKDHQHAIYLSDVLYQLIMAIVSYIV